MPKLVIGHVSSVLFVPVALACVAHGKGKRLCLAELQRIADAERRTLSQLVANIIDDCLKAQTEKKG